MREKTTFPNAATADGTGMMTTRTAVGYGATLQVYGVTPGLIPGGAGGVAPSGDLAGALGDPHGGLPGLTAGPTGVQVGAMAGATGDPPIMRDRRGDIMTLTGVGDRAGAIGEADGALPQLSHAAITLPEPTPRPAAEPPIPRPGVL